MPEAPNTVDLGQIGSAASPAWRSHNQIPDDFWSFTTRLILFTFASLAFATGGTLVMVLQSRIGGLIERLMQHLKTTISLITTNVTILGSPTSVKLIARLEFAKTAVLTGKSMEQ